MTIFALNNSNMAKRILVTGASGFVGSRFVSAMRDRYELLTPSHHALDITSAEDVEQYIAHNHPDTILHLAALSNTWYCENNPEESYKVNVTGVENLARAAAKHNAKFVFFSSDQVYNGNHEQGLLNESVELHPENHYGRHKLLAEQRATAACNDSVALRATWMYDHRREGMPLHGNFVVNIKNAIESGTPIKFATREYRGITWVEDVISNLPHTFSLPGGVYNFGAENSLNSYETACAYCTLLGKNPEEIIIADKDRFPEHKRNISISMQKATKASKGAIKFSDTLRGLEIFEKRNNV